jgi:hypothetical protein
MALGHPGARARAYPLRRVVDLRHEIVADLGFSKLDRATEILSCGHTGHTYITVYPAELWPGQQRRCSQCASPAQRARAKEEAVRR